MARDHASAACPYTRLGLLLPYAARVYAVLSVMALLQHSGRQPACTERDGADKGDAGGGSRFLSSLCSAGQAEHCSHSGEGGQEAVPEGSTWPWQRVSQAV